MPGFRLTYLLIFVLAVSLLLVALYMQYGMGLEPCALCITQRGFIVVIGVTGLIAWAHCPRSWGRWIYTGTGCLAAALGAAVAGRQLWLQSLPDDKVPACGPSLGYILDSFPLRDALAVLLRGDGNCAEVSWTFMSLSIPGWTLIAFIAFAALFLWQGARRRI